MNKLYEALAAYASWGLETPPEGALRTMLENARKVLIKHRDEIETGNASCPP